MPRERALQTFEPGTLDRIDQVRGELPRTRWIEAAVRLALSPPNQEWRAVIRAAAVEQVPEAADGRRLPLSAKPDDSPASAPVAEPSLARGPAEQPSPIGKMVRVEGPLDHVALAQAERLRWANAGRKR